MLMSVFSFFGCRKSVPSFPEDKIIAKDGSEITITFIRHASLAFEWNGHRIYVDPVGGDIDYASMPKADLILVTHSHYDHFELPVIETLGKDDCTVICNRETASSFDFDCITMTPGDIAEPFSGLTVKAVPAYNISEGRTDFHPRSREDCGYILTMGGTVIYVAGDTEDNEDVMSLTGIDIAFLPVNQPYTMTVDQAVRVVKAVRPEIFYPYHYGQVEEKTDIAALVSALEGVCDVRVRPME